MLLVKVFALLFLPILAVATPMPGGAPSTTTPKVPTTTPKVPTTTPQVPTTTPKEATTTVTVTATETQPGGVSQCNTGPLLCCNSVQKASDEPITSLLGLLGVVLHDLTVLIGLTCDPLSVIGVGGAGCSAAPVCCQNNTFNGLIAIGCVPITINL